MQVAIREIGNSKGIILHKSMLAHPCLTDIAIAGLSVDGTIVLRKPI
jgi:hypothetical protein